MSFPLVRPHRLVTRIFSGRSRICWHWQLELQAKNHSKSRVDSRALSVTVGEAQADGPRAAGQPGHQPGDRRPEPCSNTPWQHQAPGAWGTSGTQ
jgi:hypothetical protein